MAKGDGVVGSARDRPGSGLLLRVRVVSTQPRKVRAVYTDGTYVAQDVADRLREALARLRADEGYEAVDYLTEAAHAAGPGRLSERLAGMADDLAAELEGEEPTQDHDYRWEIQQDLDALRDQVRREEVQSCLR